MQDLKWFRQTLATLKRDASGLPSGAQFVAQIVPGTSHRLAVDGHGNVCFLFSSIDTPTGSRPSLRLAHAKIDFNVNCSIWTEQGDVKSGAFTLIATEGLSDLESEALLGVASASIALSGPQPTHEELRRTLNAIVDLLQRLRAQPTHSVSGLFGELLVIHEAADASAAVDAWRTSESSKYDFAIGELRLDAKTTRSRNREHEVTYEQCNPPDGLVGVFASVLLDEIGNGTSIANIVEAIEDRLAGQARQVTKLRETVFSTLGRSIDAYDLTRFDLAAARAQLRYFETQGIPAIRPSLPTGVSGLRFRSNLDMATAVPSPTSLGLNAKCLRILPPAKSLSWRH